MRIPLTTKNSFSIVTGVAVSVEAIIPLLVPASHLSWHRWQFAIIAIAVLAVASIIVQAVVQSREEHGRDEREHRILAILEQLRGPEPVAAQTVEISKGGSQPQAHPIGISAKCLRAHLSKRHPFGDIIEDVYRAMGKTHGIECDLLMEVHLVNTDNSPITVQKIIAEVESGGVWQPLELNDELRDYQIRFPSKLIDAVGGGYTPLVNDLEPNLAKQLRGVSLVRGVGYQGWLRFGGTLNSGDLAAQNQIVNARAKIIDALDNGYAIDMSSLLKDGEIIHNPDVWGKRLSNLA